jgi:hypothetical protein
MVLVVERVDFVRHRWLTVLHEQPALLDLVGCSLAGLDREAELEQPTSYHLKDGVVSERRWCSTDR